MAFFDKSDSGYGGGELTTVIGPEAIFHGSMTVRGSVRVEGEVEGNITDAVEVVVGRGGRVRGNVTAERAEVGGVVVGDVTTTVRLEIKSGGRVTGNIRPTKLLVEDGAVFDGNCVMAESAEPVRP